MRLLSVLFLVLVGCATTAKAQFGNHIQNGQRMQQRAWQMQQQRMQQMYQNRMRAQQIQRMKQQQRAAQMTAMRRAKNLQKQAEEQQRKSLASQTEQDAFGHVGLPQLNPPQHSRRDSSTNQSQAHQQAMENLQMAGVALSFIAAMSGDFMPGAGFAFPGQQATEAMREEARQAEQRRFIREHEARRAQGGF